jgi:hypothetical protein
MRRILVRAGTEDLKELNDILSGEGLELRRKVQLNLNENEFVHYITVGGGALGLAKCLISYLKLKYQKRKITIISNGKKISIESYSVEEITTLLNDAEEFMISDK